MNESRRVAIVTTHPIQYYAPWFRWIAANTSLRVKVFYLWDFGVRARRDPGFQHEVQWDIALLEGYEFEFVPNASSQPGTDHFWGIRNPQLLERLRGFQPDAALLIGYNYPSFLRLIFTSARRRGFQLIMRGDSHRLGTSRSGKWKVESRKWIISKIFRRFAACLYVGAANREYFRSHGLDDSKIFFSPHAVDNERFMAEPEKVESDAAAWREDLGIPPDHLLVMFAGKFETKKRPLDLLEAFGLLNRRDVSLLFVGAGPLEDRMRAGAAGTRNVFFAPFQNQSQMPRTYRACDLFVLPSRGPEETWGLSINEALCLGRAVVVSDHVGCAQDLIRPGGNGLVFLAGSVAALAAALADALSDRDRLIRWGAAGRDIVSHYDFAAATAGLVDAVKGMASPKRNSINSAQPIARPSSRTET